MIQIRRQVRIEAQRRSRSYIQNRLEDLRGAAAAKRQRACGHLVEHCAKREQVTPRVDILARACSGDMQATVPSAVPGLVKCWSSIVAVIEFIDAELEEPAGVEPGQPEVENLGVSALGHEDVCRFNVTVNYAFGMGC